MPNAFVSDPPLRAVKSRTLEAGLRGAANAITWSAAVHQSTSDDDLLFISSGPLRAEGHFANVGTTRRRGVELAAGGRVARRVQWSGSYAFLDATFASSFRVAAPNHPGASDGEIAVKRGDRLPLVPRHVLKLGATVDLTSRVRAAASFRATAEQFFRGDEGNLAKPLPAYVLADARGEYAITRRVRIILDVQNIFDRDYATFGTFGDAEDVLGDDYGESTRFITPAPPACSPPASPCVSSRRHGRQRWLLRLTARRRCIRRSRLRAAQRA
ncbi:MAG: TonB-dependent receptor domain-containing protein [Thermoanaerobaculia bacterium]